MTAPQLTGGAAPVFLVVWDLFYLINPTTEEFRSASPDADGGLTLFCTFPPAKKLVLTPFFCVFNYAFYYPPEVTYYDGGRFILELDYTFFVGFF